MIFRILRVLLMVSQTLRGLRNNYKKKKNYKSWAYLPLPRFSFKIIRKTPKMLEATFSISHFKHHLSLINVYFDPKY